MSGMPILNWATDPVIKLRDGYNAERAAIAHFSAQDVVIEEVDFTSGTGLSFIPPDPLLGPDILYFHGGGWIVGSPWTHRTLCSWMAKLSGHCVFAAPYNLAPEHKFPVQADQAGEITSQFSQDRDNIILAGDSAGGAMALWAAESTIEHAKIKGIVSLYGAFGCLDGPSHWAFGKNSDGLQSLALLAMYQHLGCEDVTDFRSRFSTSGAPILLVKAECDPIADDNDWLAANTQHPVTHLLAPHQPHGYLQSCGADRAAEASMAQISEWINKLT